MARDALRRVKWTTLAHEIPAHYSECLFNPFCPFHVPPLENQVAYLGRTEPRSIGDPRQPFGGTYLNVEFQYRGMRPLHDVGYRPLQRLRAVIVGPPVMN